MKQHLFFRSWLILICLMCISSRSFAVTNLSALLPYPNHITQGSGSFQFSKAETISLGNSSLTVQAEELRGILKRRLGSTDISIGGVGRIQLRLDSSLKGREQYRLTITSKRILIEGKTAAGVLYGIYTLDQILLGDVTKTADRRIQTISIEDAPAYPYRALMLDPARHFLPLEGVKKYIRTMAYFKYNILQLHLTDDQGWRIEIKSHPKLTSVGSVSGLKRGKGSFVNGFYTQEEIKELVKYADSYNVQIVPEIDMPGHTAALLSVYPDLRCDILKDSSFVIGRTDNVMLTAANPRVYQVVDDVIREIAQLFPSKTIHLGGDESAIKKNWAKSPENLRLMKEKGYTKPEQLMNVFFGNVLGSVRKYGLHAILWCELDNIYEPAHEYLFDYPKDVTLVTWRNALTPKCIELTHKAGNSLILAPGEYAYFDYPQYRNDLPEYNNWGMPTTTLEKTYSFDPTYGLPFADRKHIIGVMGTLWGEAISDINRAFYMTYPRALALAEAGWTDGKNRGWESFKKRLYPNLSDLMEQGVSFRVPFEIAK